ncbi:hypothetical protein PsorP6_015249 [Peronosclerospora sorghi]|uniref:Uncharacterized protein n=1 Tax=Peronosclerospora sorghi TaxID=230839 RepID=A0ACC0VUT8_9STRA|nr:hypothetical protein PsorP6_015249 [Peronosclerospora sorghi]
MRIVFMCSHTELEGCHVERLVLHLSHFDEVFRQTGSAGQPLLFLGGATVNAIDFIVAISQDRR